MSSKRLRDDVFNRDYGVSLRRTSPDPARARQLLPLRLANTNSCLIEESPQLPSKVRELFK